MWTQIKTGQREFVADATAARLTRDPEALASALERLSMSAALEPAVAQPSPATASLFIVNPFAGMGSTLLNLFSTHPPMAARVARLRAMSREHLQVA